MAKEISFDLYDERWRDCWLAATSTARLRKKQVDIEIDQRVAKLLRDFGPQSENPLTLRIYGTMIKGFCVINNERARMLYCECERVVIMFARQPFAEGDNKIRLPAAKRQRMEAALTLDLDLARVEASEAFDWTQAPLEEGSLLRLGGIGGQISDTLLPSIELLAQADAVGVMPELLDPAFAGDIANASAGYDAGWLPKGAFDAPVERKPEKAEAELLDPVMTQLAMMGLEPEGQSGMQLGPNHEDTKQSAALALKRKRHERAAAALLRPGMVYGFDAEPMMSATDYDAWQHDSTGLVKPRLRAPEYAQELQIEVVKADHLGPRLRALIDPPDGVFLNAKSSGVDWQMPVQSLLGTVADVAMDGQCIPNAFNEAPVASSELKALETILVGGGEGVVYDGLHLNAADGQFGFAPAGDAEVQDDRTAEVGEIIKGCLRKDAGESTAFDYLVPPGSSDRATAACTFAALLALASAGELLVQQSAPFAQILISDIYRTGMPR